MPSERGRPRGGGFLQVAQVDVDDDGDRTERRRLSGRERFRGTVQQVLRQTPFTALHNPNLPALSDGTLADQDYLSLPIQQFDEVDLENDRDRYAEVVGSYGPEAVDRNATLSHSFSTKAGKGIEVRVESYPLALSPGGLYTDDRLQDLSYRGSEEILNKPLPTSSILYNYRPVPLRRPFILILACSLVAFFALSQLTLRLLPDASSMDEALPAFQNTTEIRKRSSLRNRDVENQRYFRHGNSTDTSVSTSASSPTESSSSTEVGSTSEVESQPTSPTLSSTTKTNTLTEVSSTVVSSSTAVPSSVADSSSTTEASSTTEVTESSSATGVEGQPTSSTLSSTVENNSSTEVSSTTEIGSSTEVGNQPTLSTQPSATKSNNSTEPNPTTEPEGQPTSSIQPPATETTGISTGVQNSQPSTTNAQVTDVTPIGHGPSATNIISLTQPDEHNPTTGQNPANPPPNGPSPSGDSSSDEVRPPTQTAPDAVPADNDQNLPAPSPSQGNEAITVDSLHGTSGGQLSQPTTPNFPLVPTRVGGQQVGDKVPSQTSTNPTDVHLLDLPYPSNSQSAGESAGQAQGQLTGQAQDQTGDQHTEQNGDAIRKSSLTTDQAPSVAVVTSIQAPPSITSTITTTRGIKINTSKNILVQTNDPFDSTGLPSGPVRDAPDENEPFTTVIMTQTTETPPPITTTFTTSISIAESSFIEVTMTTIIFGHLKIADPLTDYIETITYANGTVSTISQDVYDMVFTTIESDAAGHPTKTKFAHVLRSAQETTLRDPLGYPTATLSYYDVESTTTLYDSNNIATATITTIIPETTSLSTLYDTNGVPTKTTIVLQPIPTQVVIVTPIPTSLPSPNDQRTLKLRRMPDGVYFAGLMLPTLLAIFVSIPIRILNRNVKLYQGFHALASDRGASATESLCLRTTGPASLLDGLRSLQSGQRLLGLTSVLVALSALTIPFSAEVFRLILQGPQCHSNEANTLECVVALGVFPVPGQVLSVLLILLAAGAIWVVLLLRRWETGVKHNPWNILDMAQLAASTDMQKILERLRWHGKSGHKVATKEFANKLRAKTFALREWEENGAVKYAVHIVTQELDYAAEKPAKKAGRSVAFVDPEDARRQRCLCWPSGDSVPFFMLSWAGRILFLLLLSGVLIAVLTYDIVARGSEYRRGLTGKAVGVRFLFSGAGVLITFAWGSFFNAVSFLSPYKLLKRKRLNKGRAINLNPATNPFAGLWLALVPSRRDLYLAVVAAATILSEILPLYLGNVPCNGVQIESAETICVYLSVAALSIMILTVGASFFMDWPSAIGADPSTIIGAMYNAHVFSVGRPLGRFFKKEAPGIV